MDKARGNHPHAAALTLFGRAAAGRRRWHVLHTLVLLAVWGLGFVNALVHAKDAWATMPEGLYLSAITALLALVAAWMGYSRFQAGEAARSAGYLARASPPWPWPPAMISPGPCR